MSERMNPPDKTPRTCPECGGTRWVEPTLDESAGNEGEVVPCPTCQIVPPPDAARECAERCAAAAVITKYAKEIVASKIAPIIAETLAGVRKERDDALTAEARAEKAWDTADKERTKLLASVTRLRGVLERVNTDATSNPSSQRIRASTLLDVQSALADSGPDPVAELRTRAEKAEALVASYDRQDELIGAPQLAADNEALRKEVEHSHGAVKEWAKQCDEHIEALVRLRRENAELKSAQALRFLAALADMKADRDRLQEQVRELEIEVVASNKGAECNATVNKSLARKLRVAEEQVRELVRLREHVRTLMEHTETLLTWKCTCNHPACKRCRYQKRVEEFLAATEPAGNSEPISTTKPETKIKQ